MASPISLPAAAVRYRRRVCLALACSVVAIGGGGVSASELMSAIPGSVGGTAPVVHAAPAAHTRRPAANCVHPQPARGGQACATGRCAHGRCGHDACRNGGCEIPGCPACCPVRPASFGFYGTQWRTWPGHGVMHAAHEEPAAPVMPPRSEVPSADEESPIPDFEPPAPEPEADAMPPTRVPEPESPPATLPEPDAATPEAKPAERPEKQAPDQPKESKEKSAEDNLFDEAAVQRRARERFAILQQAARNHERMRQEAIRQHAHRPARAAGSAISAAAHVESAADEPAETVSRTAYAESVSESTGARPSEAVHSPASPAKQPMQAKPRVRNPLR